MDFSKEDHRAYVDRREGRRSQVDGARYTKEQHEEYVAEQNARAQREKEESRKRLARAAYKAAGGRDAEFEKDWFELDRQERNTRLQEAARRGREAQSESRISRI